MTTNRRTFISGAALCFAACPPASAGIGIETSPRILQLRSIFARILRVEAQPGSPAQEAALVACLEELGEISTRVWASPVQSKTDILERALIAHHWCAEGASHELVWDEADGRDQAIFHLISAVLDQSTMPYSP